MPICKGSSITVLKLLSTNDLVRHRIIPPKLSIRNRLAGADEGKHHECSNFYRAMHYSAKRGLVIACRPSVRPSVTLADQDHIWWKFWKLIAQTLSLTLRSSYPKGHPPTLWGTLTILGRLEVRVGKSGMLEHTSGNISETRKDRGHVTMENL